MDELLFTYLLATEKPEGINVLLNPFQLYTIPLDDWISQSIEFIVKNFRPFFQTISLPIGWGL